MPEIPNISARHQALVQGWKQDMELQQHPHNTVRTYLSSLRAWLTHLDVTPPQAAGKTQLKSYAAELQRLKRAPSTFQSHFAAISSLFSYMIEEEMIENNPVPQFQERYMRLIGRQVKRGKDEERRQLISVQQASEFIASIGDVRDRTINAGLAKLGVRREEFVAIDVEDIDHEKQRIRIKDHFPKRSNSWVYFDDEYHRLMKRWLKVRQSRGADPDKGPFITGQHGERLGAKSGLYNAVVGYAVEFGIHDPKSKHLHEKFGAHCWRHWFTTHLIRAGMPGYMVAELRGDSETHTMDIYNHVDHEELRRVYQARMPKLGL